MNGLSPTETLALAVPAAVVLMGIVGILTVLYFYALSKKVHYQ